MRGTTPNPHVEALGLAKGEGMQRGERDLILDKMERDVYKCRFALANPDTYLLLKEKAEHNRKHPTDAESRIWQYLRTEFADIRFRREYIIGDYIVDFVALKQRLIIEVDGEYHFDETQQEEDRARESWLKQQGFKVIRFTNDEVLKDIESVVRAVRAEI